MDRDYWYFITDDSKTWVLLGLQHTLRFLSEHKSELSDIAMIEYGTLYGNHFECKSGMFVDDFLEEVYNHSGL